MECTRIKITQNQHTQQSKGFNSVTKKWKSIIIIRDILSSSDTHSLKVS